MRTFKIHMIRHGMTDANRLGIFYGSTDIPLNDEGIADLKTLTEDYSYPQAEWVFSSPLLRAFQTARIIYGNREIIEIEDLQEMSFGTFEGRSMHETGDDRFSRFIAGDSSAAPDDSESSGDFINRCINAFAAIVETMMTSNVHTAAIVTHASVIGNILSALAYPKAMPYEWNPSPGCGYTVIADPTLFLREPVLEVTAQIPQRLESSSYDPDLDLQFYE
ncbi:MAG: histidine phosphatase family protein [Oscillospiraceae bacterium]|nr:histidine phosphatase family protein [Oscillospiraceae bacterium]